MSDRLTAEATAIRNIFNNIATEYDDLNDRLSLGQHKIWKLMSIKWSNPQLGDTALDLCCGSGDLALMMAKQVGKQGKVVGLDFACAQLEIAAQREQATLPGYNLQWQEGDALNLPFENNHFDCATMGYGLRNVTDIPRCLQEIYRVLKPGAAIAILDFHRPEFAVMNTFQQWYLQQIVIPTAKSFNLTEEYTYLLPSLAKFPQGKEQVKLAYSSGFARAVHYPLIGGMMGVLVLQK